MVFKEGDIILLYVQEMSDLRYNSKEGQWVK